MGYSSMIQVYTRIPQPRPAGDDTYSVLVEGLLYRSYYEAVRASAGGHKGNVVTAEPDGAKRTEQLAATCRHSASASNREVLFLATWVNSVDMGLK